MGKRAVKQYPFASPFDLFIADAIGLGTPIETFAIQRRWPTKSKERRIEFMESILWTFLTYENDREHVAAFFDTSRPLSIDKYRVR